MCSHPQNKAMGIGTGTQNEEILKRENPYNEATWVRKEGVRVTEGLRTTQRLLASVDYNGVN